MNEINCPHCKKAFTIDEAGYADILKQVRDSEFDQQLHERLELAEKEKINAVELANEQARNEMHKAATTKWKNERRTTNTHKSLILTLLFHSILFVSNRIE